MAKIKLMGSTFETDANGPYEVRGKIQEALKRFDNTNVEITDTEKGIINVDTGFPNRNISRSFWVEWTSADETHPQPMVTIHSEGGYFFISNPRMVAEVARALLRPTTRVLIGFYYTDGDASITSEEAFAVNKSQIVPAHRRWTMRYPGNINLLIDAVVWEGQNDDIVHEKERKPQKHSKRKLNIEGLK